MKESKAVSAIEKLGGTVERDDAGTVVDVYLVCTETTDARLEMLLALPELRTLNVGETKISDRGMLTLAQLGSLRELNIGYNGLTDEGLRYVASLTGLKSLSLENLDVTADGLRHVAHLNGLESLCLNGLDIGDEELALFEGLTELKRLEVDETRVTDASLDLIKGFAKLDHLRAFDSLITRDGFDALQAALPDLYIFYNIYERSPDEEAEVEPPAEDEPVDETDKEPDEPLIIETSVYFGPAEERLATRLNRLFAACRSLRGSNPAGYQNARAQLDSIREELEPTPIRMNLIENSVLDMSGGTFHWDP